MSANNGKISIRTKIKRIIQLFTFGIKDAVEISRMPDVGMSKSSVCRDILKCYLVVKTGNFSFKDRLNRAFGCLKHGVTSYTFVRYNKEYQLDYRNNGIEKPTFIPREKIVEQFMPVNENLDKTGQMKAASNNYNKIIGLIKEIKQNYYQDLNIGLDDSGVTLYKSPTPILKDDTRYALITSDI